MATNVIFFENNLLKSRQKCNSKISF